MQGFVGADLHKKQKQRKKCCCSDAQTRLPAAAHRDAAADEEVKAELKSLS